MLRATVLAILAARTALHSGLTPANLILGVLCCLMWLYFLLLPYRRIRSLAATPIPPAPSPTHALLAILCTVASAVCGAVLLF